MATYLELAALIGNVDFQTRVRYAVNVLAGTVLRTAGATSTEKQWARSVLDGQKNLAIGTLTLWVTLAPQVQTSGAAITDAQLQGIVDALKAQIIGVLA